VVRTTGRYPGGEEIGEVQDAVADDPMSVKPLVEPRNRVSAALGGRGCLGGGVAALGTSSVSGADEVGLRDETGKPPCEEDAGCARAGEPASAQRRRGGKASHVGVRAGRQEQIQLQRIQH
jgi:hypothetical protein